MIQASTLSFLSQLKEHNDKTWFDAHRKEYESAKQDFEAFVTALKNELISLEPELAGQPAKDCIHRIFRDVRFSKDKTPYKAHFSAVFKRGGKKLPTAGYYLHMEPGSAFAGGGMWQPEPPILKSLRQEIDYDLSGFESMINKPSFRKMFKQLDGERMTRPPQGYDAGNPAIEYLKMKSFTVGHSMTDKEFTGKGAVQKVAAVFTEMSPLINFLNRAIA